MSNVPQNMIIIRLIKEQLICRVQTLQAVETHDRLTNHIIKNYVHLT